MLNEVGHLMRRLLVGQKLQREVALAEVRSEKAAVPMREACLKYIAQTVEIERVGGLENLRNECWRGPRCLPVTRPHACRCRPVCCSWASAAAARAWRPRSSPAPGGCRWCCGSKMENSFGYSELRGGGNNPNIFSSFLTWMQGKPPGVFVVPTANRIEKLPVEVIRKRRCDRLFFPDLPRPMPSASAFWTSICGRTTPIRQPSTLLRCRP
jgi:SpoVK/Ycf46/Vps4 family AAA+-type ATPase